MPIVGTTSSQLTRSFLQLKGGVLDTAFMSNLGSSVNNFVFSTAVQSDNKILIAGNHTTFNGVGNSFIFRLNSNGTKDTTFTDNVGTGPAGVNYSIGLQSDGKIIGVGAFSTFNGVTVNGIYRLSSDGTRDTTFTTNTGTAVSNVPTTQPRVVAVQSDDKILVGGNFTAFNGSSNGALIRLNSDGTRDTTFSSNLGSGVVALGNGIQTIKVQADGKILVGGSFTSVSGVTTNRFFRLNSDGTKDASFTTNVGTSANNTVNGIAVQSDGKIVLCGTFSSFNGSSVTATKIIRLNSDGTRDTAFTTTLTNDGLDTRSFSSSVPFSIAVQSDDKILVGGSFTNAYGGADANDQPKLFRLNSDGTRDAAFSINNEGAAGFSGSGGASGTYVHNILLQPDGKILLGTTSPTYNTSYVGYLVRLGGAAA